MCKSKLQTFSQMKVEALKTNLPHLFVLLCETTILYLRPIVQFWIPFKSASSLLSTVAIATTVNIYIPKDRFTSKWVTASFQVSKSFCFWVWEMSRRINILGGQSWLESIVTEPSEIQYLTHQAELIGASFASASLWLFSPDRMTSIAHGWSWTLTQRGRISG